MQLIWTRIPIFSKIEAKLECIGPRHRNNQNQPNDADGESIRTLSVSTLRAVLELSNVAFVFHLLCLHYHFDLP